MPINFKQIEPLTNLELLANQVVEGFITGLHKSPLHGFSVEFAEHRQYNKGESTRHIDWKLYGRTDKLYIKRYEEETNLRCQIVVDVSSSMYFPGKEWQDKKIPYNKLEYAVHCAAALINLMRRQRDAVGCSLFSDHMEVATEAKTSLTHQRYLYQLLEGVMDRSPEQRGTFATAALHQVAEQIHRRSLVVIFSDMMESSGESQEALFSALQHLKHNQHEVVLFHVQDKKRELNFDLDNRPYLLVDPETGEEVRVLPGEIRDHYLSKMSQLTKSVKLKCGQYRIDYVNVDINEPFDQVLLAYLLRRKSIR